jgi:hypothetical protein
MNSKGTFDPMSLESYTAARNLWNGHAIAILSLYGYRVPTVNRLVTEGSNLALVLVGATQDA